MIQDDKQNEFDST